MPGEHDQWGGEYVSGRPGEGQRNDGAVAVDADHGQQTYIVEGTQSLVLRMIEARHPGKKVWQFALVPGSAPRVLLPLASAIAFRRALRMHRPGRLLGRLGTSLLYLLALKDLHRPFLRKVLCIVLPSDSAVPQGLLQSGLSPADIGEGEVALYISSEDRPQRIVVLPLGQGEPLRVVKQANSPDAVASLRAERAALAELSGSSIGDCIPEVLHWQESDPAGEYAALHMTYHERRRTSAPRLRSAANRFLRGLAAIDRVCSEVGPWLQRHASQGSPDPAWTRLRRALEAQDPKRHQLILHRTHGDFSPWNISMTQGGLLVYDWEMSRVQGLALSDAYHFVVAPHYLLNGLCHPRRVLRRAIAWASPLGRAQGLGQKEQMMHLGAWLLAHRPELRHSGLSILRDLVAERLK